MPEFVLDEQRAGRIGFGEAVYCAGKSLAQIAAILERVQAEGHAPMLLTRLDPERFAALPAGQRERHRMALAMHVDLQLLAIRARRCRKQPYGGAGLADRVQPQRLFGSNLVQLGKADGVHVGIDDGHSPRRHAGHRRQPPAPRGCDGPRVRRGSRHDAVRRAKFTPRVQGRAVEQVHRVGTAVECESSDVETADRNKAEQWYGDVMGFSRVDELESWAEDGPLTLSNSSGGGSGASCRRRTSSEGSSS